MSSVFKIFSPEDCDFYYDGDQIGHITGNSPKAFRFEVERKGTYRVQFVNSEFKSILRMTLSIDADEEQDIELNFSEVNAEAKRRIRIEEDKRKAEEEAERKRIEEERKKREAEEAERRRRIEAEKRKAEEAERRRIEEERRKREAEEAERRRRLEAEKRKAEEAEKRRIETEKRRAEEAERRRIEEEKKRSEAIKISYEKRVKFVDQQNAAKHACRMYIFGFSEGLSPMENSEGKWGFIDKTGKEIIPYIYDECRKFKDGLAFVKQNHKWGCIDKEGNVRIPFIYYLDRFLDNGSNEYVYVERPEGWGILDARRIEVVPCQYRSYRPSWNSTHIINGFIEVINDNNHKHGLMNMDGNVIVPCIYDYVGTFSEGLVAVRKDDKTSYLDKTGRVVIKTEEFEGGYFSNGLAYTRDGYIDKSGNIIRSKYAFHGNFSEGLAYFEDTASRRLGYINRNFNEVFTFNSDDYDFMTRAHGRMLSRFYTEFREGLAPVIKNRKYGFINKTGKLVVPCIYDDLRDYRVSKQFVYLKKNGKFGCIDKNGKEILPFIYDSVGEFSEGLACVFRDDKYGFVDMTGKEIIPCRSLPKLYY